MWWQTRKSFMYQLSNKRYWNVAFIDAFNQEDKNWVYEADLQWAPPHSYKTKQSLENPFINHQYIWFFNTHLVTIPFLSYRCTKSSWFTCNSVVPSTCQDGTTHLDFTNHIRYGHKLDCARSRLGLLGGRMYFMYQVRLVLWVISKLSIICWIGRYRVC
jgi:hypothetical protein